MTIIDREIPELYAQYHKSLVRSFGVREIHMVPARHDLTVYRDRDYSRVFVFQDSDGVIIDLTGYSAKAQIRPEKDSSTLTESFGIDLDGSAGKITISLTDEQTLALASGKFWWDLALTDPSGLRQSYVEGSVFVKATVTRV